MKTTGIQAPEHHSIVPLRGRKKLDVRALFAVCSNLQSTEDPCGSELARDSCGSGDINVECHAAFTSKLAQGIFIAGNFLPGTKNGLYRDRSFNASKRQA
ncbi:hypothetical protein HNR03_006369 [Pseudomonas sp. JAI111]|uniref:hypothetical protein n=1 Tax=Pseudomonas sp. JAI111 TaxID=2735913 RepID=UPI002168C395|nr:hypothetical protein [Pseudomonas sp. JAI111]MCS3841732.1 hypothetical protein [Pseudomonas sp. JAI111]